MLINSKRRVTTGLIVGAFSLTVLGLATPAYGSPSAEFATAKLAAESKTKYTNVNANVRSGPGTNKSKVGGTLPRGTKVTVTKTSQGWSDEHGKNVSWSKISSPRTGWIRSDLLSGSKNKDKKSAKGTFSDPYSFGTKIHWSDGSWVKYSKPKKVTGTLAAAENVGGNYYAPMPGNDYWVMEGAVFNAGTGSWNIYWYGSDPRKNTIGFKSNGGIPYIGGCPARFERLYNAHDTYVPARSEVSVYWCVEAPSNALSSGKFAWSDDANVLKYFFK